MQGITILAERQIPTNEHNMKFMKLMIISKIVGGIIGAIANIFVSLNNALGGLGIVTGMLCIIVGIAFGETVAEAIIPYKYETVYDVLIDSNVSLTKFLKHYEIIEQDGLIFTVREI